MDPKANIKRQREIAKEIIQIADATTRAGSYTEPLVATMEDAATELAELVIALDEWRLKGGFDPYLPGPYTTTSRP
jgi:hypothetical protein